MSKIKRRYEIQLLDGSVHTAHAHDISDIVYGNLGVPVVIYDGVLIPMTSILLIEEVRSDRGSIHINHHTLGSDSNADR